MSGASASSAAVVALWRYPVKSMMGEDLNSLEVASRGIVGDRTYALVDAETGKVASAKNPKKWPGLFDCHAAFCTPPTAAAPAAAVQITLPDGTLISSDRSDAAELLSAALGRKVTLESAVPAEPTLEEYWPDIQELDHQDAVTDESMPAETFFDLAAVHLLTTATIDQLRGAYPEGRFEVRRFRPNIVVAPPAGKTGFVENDWIGHTLAIGDEVRLKITEGTPRCVMPTLAQGDLPKDQGILRAAIKENKAHVGVYAAVIQGGAIRRGDAVSLVD